MFICYRGNIVCAFIVDDGREVVRSAPIIRRYVQWKQLGQAMTILKSLGYQVEEIMIGD